MNINKNLNTYLGNKGYTISKSELGLEQIERIKKELTVKPYVPGSPANNSQVSFPVYRESASKIYMPHYYGIEKFGPPKEIRVSAGQDIALEFNGQLRDYQAPVVEKFVQYVKSEDVPRGGLLELPCAWGKTSASLNILSRLGKKTIVIVHKEFLMNQWIERIGQFLPKARIGKIQGQIIDIDHKDIVLCMLQSLSMKEYPSEIFDSFGLTIIDEVHHISSEVFSNTLFKLVTKYMLGLSATMNRKDGTTNIFKMFLGQVICKEKRDDAPEVVVRAIDYFVDDDDFNHVSLDYRGNVQYSTMISKLCEYNRRSEFILRVLEDLLKENPNQQIMIIAHNRNLLKYFYETIKHRGIAGGSCGYYVGGMKEAALKETESKKIVIATFSMCSEGLDIKTLTTLIMTTPKTDIEQTVGRILREKHSEPIVVDIIDHHDPFQKQWKKRKTFYMKENYKILHIKDRDYLNSTIESRPWTTVFNPKEDKKGKKTKEKEKEISNEFTKKDDVQDLKGTCFLKIKK